MHLGATTYYVAKTGNDGNPGTEAEPWLTVGKSVKILAAGDTLWIKAGTYDEPLVNFGYNAGTAAAPIVIKGYDGWNSIVQAPIKVCRAHFIVESLKIVLDTTCGVSQAFKFDSQGGKRGDSGVIRNCELTQTERYSHYTNGVNVGNMHGSVIDSNTIHGFGQRDATVGYGMYVEASGTTVTNNTVYDISSYGLHVYSDGRPIDSCEIAYNLIYDTHGGMIVAGSYNNIHHNIVYSSSFRGVYLWRSDGHDNEVSNNVIYNSAFFALNLAGNGAVNTVRNNICIGAKAIATESGNPSTFDYNCYFPANAAFWYSGSNWGLATWQATSGQDAHSIEANPCVADTGAHDFRLSDSSPCIDAGDPTTPPRYDIEGITAPQDAAVDIGAYEFCQTGVKTPPESTSAKKFTIAPNPVSGGFATVRYNLPEAGSATFEVFNASGRLVRSSFVVQRSSFQIDLRSMPAGVYMVRVTSDGASSTQKLVVAGN